MYDPIMFPYALVVFAAVELLVLLFSERLSLELSDGTV